MSVEQQVAKLETQVDYLNQDGRDKKDVLDRLAETTIRLTETSVRLTEISKCLADRQEVLTHSHNTSNQKLDRLSSKIYKLLGGSAVLATVLATVFSVSIDSAW